MILSYTIKYVIVYIYIFNMKWIRHDRETTSKFHRRPHNIRLSLLWSMLSKSKSIRAAKSLEDRTSPPYSANTRTLTESSHFLSYDLSVIVTSSDLSTKVSSDAVCVITCRDENIRARTNHMEKYYCLHFYGSSEAKCRAERRRFGTTIRQ